MMKTVTRRAALSELTAMTHRELKNAKDTLVELSMYAEAAQVQEIVVKLGAMTIAELDKMDESAGLPGKWSVASAPIPSPSNRESNQTGDMK